MGFVCFDLIRLPNTIHFYVDDNYINTITATITMETATEAVRASTQDQESDGVALGANMTRLLLGSDCTPSIVVYVHVMAFVLLCT